MLFDSLAYSAAAPLDIVLYNNVIDACLRFKDYQKARQLYSDIISKKITLTEVTYALILRLHAKTDQLDQMEQLYE